MRIAFLTCWLFAACSSSEVKPQPTAAQESVAVDETGAPDVAAPSEPAEDPSCKRPCGYLAALPFDDAATRYRSSCFSAWATPDVGRCEAFDALRACVLDEAAKAGDDPEFSFIWALLSTQDERLRETPGLDDPTDAKRQAMARSARANAAELTELARSCRATEHPTAGVVSLDLASRAVSFGERTFALPTKVDLAHTEVLDLGTERVVTIEHDGKPKRDGYVPTVTTIYAVRKGKLVALGSIDGPSEWNLPGDGTINRTVERDVTRGYRQQYRLGPTRLQMTEHEIDGYVCDDCTACPYVFVAQADGSLVEAGEVLRYMAGAAAERTDDLEIRIEPGQTTVTLELAELKAETSYLDAIALVVDGVTVAPRECAKGGAACADDGVYETFGQGERRRFTFALPTAHGASARVVANGYYLPDAH